ncbi:uncharacterized protein LOC106012311 [Aplysia californica]|uniref:Uncharacterized protein LOC106012311 n=1 Tax=Aplysia californica TaxID=6500 RepID=A0ABM1A3Y9_APLCA|nr:uncharacterized protein LOC106012311 [Aplysia californica]
MEFFYDTDNRLSVMTARGFEVKRDSSDEECIVVRCITHDVDFIHKIHRLAETALLLGSSIPRSLKEQSMIDYAIIVSHPHGSPKTISIGQLLEYRKIPDRAGILKRVFRQMAGKQRLSLRVTTYSSATCPGCTGAPVITGYEDGWGWWAMTHTLADLNSGVNMAFT